VNLQDLLKKSRQHEAFSKEELIWMLELAPESPESYQIMHEARRLSLEITGNQHEVHAQLALNLAPCPKNCKFCSFAVINGVFDKPTKLSHQEAVRDALILEQAGASAVYVMATANYDFGEFLEISAEIKHHLKPETVFVANVGDRTPEEAQRMAEVGFHGVYHALRLREGTDTAIPPQKRLDSFRAFKEAGLGLGTCVEPVGPEHSAEEIAELILLTGSLEPAYSGAARRISIPGTEMAVNHGMIPELRQAQIVAVTRLGVPASVKGNCTHEPCSLGAAAGASLFWAEIGANPRDTQERTEDGRGADVARCAQLFWEAGCGVLKGPSNYYMEGRLEQLSSAGQIK
jgi:biotin synthase